MDFLEWPRLYWPEELTLIREFLTDQEFAEMLGRLRYLLAMPQMGDVPLFPAPTDDTMSVRRETVAKWLLNAERLAKLPKLVGGTFHPYRLWGTERKHLPDVAVAAAGGWKDTGALRQSYLQADGATVLRVVENEG